MRTRLCRKAQRHERRAGGGWDYLGNAARRPMGPTSISGDQIMHTHRKSTDTVGHHAMQRRRGWLRVSLYRAASMRLHALSADDSGWSW